MLGFVHYWSEVESVRAHLSNVLKQLENSRDQPLPPSQVDRKEVHYQHIYIICIVQVHETSFIQAQ